MMLSTSTSRPAVLAQARGCGCRCFTARSPLRPARLRRGVRAAAAGDETPQTPMSLQALEFSKDEENFKDVFAFSGELPERLNGRLAMWAFAAMMITEASTHVPFLQQAETNYLSAISWTATIALASLAPKFASGNSLKNLHEAASRDGLPPVLSFFNKTHELWLGRVAMIGLVGTAAVEAIKGSPLITG
mmetsp:Transcript_6754/g.19429  ORF Transcript_6754/g.19429 Transcript_6754/m.19429 type:complete len:190 (-) Transcript_6754:5135-5704(-)